VVWCYCLSTTITSYCRLQMVKDVLSINEHVIRVATDSIASTKPITHLKYGTEIGEYKKENIKAIRIINCYNSVQKV
jgi:predicted ThiF/HesA family dinucleotide-utilizing enzyme